MVEQHYSTEFWKFLKHQYKVEKVSGDSQLKISFTQIVQTNDIIICTAQILENYLERADDGDDEGIQLSGLAKIFLTFDISLIVLTVPEKYLFTSHLFYFYIYTALYTGYSY